MFADIESSTVCIYPESCCLSARSYKRGSGSSCRRQITGGTRHQEVLSGSSLLPRLSDSCAAVTAARRAEPILKMAGKGTPLILASSMVLHTFLSIKASLVSAELNRFEAMATTVFAVAVFEDEDLAKTSQVMRKGWTRGVSKRSMANELADEG